MCCVCLSLSHFMSMRAASISSSPNGILQLSTLSTAMHTSMHLIILILLTGGVILFSDGIVHHHTASSSLNFTYHNNNELTTFLKEIAFLHPELAALYSIGQSTKKKELWALRVTSRESAVLGTPNVKYIGNIHGNEPVGRELILHFADYLVRNYQTDEEVRWLLDRTVIHLLPSLNPDGFETSEEGDCDSVTGRNNANSVDLNRSFPDFFRQNKIPQQPETKSVMKWLSVIPFVVSASFHGGVLVASYPYENDADTGVDGYLPRYLTAPDDDTFRYLAEVYAGNHPRMSKGGGCKMDGSAFPGGITNGGEWYKVTGGMQDYNYIRHGCMELTLEVSCCKYPPSEDLFGLWNDNLRGMMELAKRSHLGIRGLVMDSITGNGIPSAVLSVIGRDINFTSAETGEFWRVLLPGEYTLRVNADGYHPQIFPFAVRLQNETFPEATWLNLYMKPDNRSESMSGAFALRPALYLFVFLRLLLG